MSDTSYIHGTDPAEQARLTKLGELTDEAFVEFVQVKRTDKVLDVGSGLGNVARRVALMASEGEVLGIEQSAEQLAQAQKHRLPNLSFQQGDAHALSLANETFDVAYCRYLLEHVADPGQVLCEIRRVLKPGGKFYVQENNILIHLTDPECPKFEHLWRQFAKLQTQLGGDAEIGKKLFRLLREAGFENVVPSIQAEVHFYGMPTYSLWLENLISIVRYAEPQLLARQLATADEIIAGIEGLQRFIKNPVGCAYFYWNRATGQKPA